MPPPGLTREAVVAVIIRGRDVLLIRRGADVPDPGYWAPPSGTIESGESQEAAVIREVREEVGNQWHLRRLIHGSPRFPRRRDGGVARRAVFPG